MRYRLPQDRWRARAPSCAILPVSTLTWVRMVLVQGEENRAARAMLAGMLIVITLAIALVLYVYLALCLQRIGTKTNAENPWLAWIPFANLILMLNIARKPLWWIGLLLIPVVNLVIAILVWMEIAKARNKPGWWGILVVVPVANLIALAYLAFSD
jgi:hypothetical protein